MSDTNKKAEEMTEEEKKAAEEKRKKLEKLAKDAGLRSNKEALEAVKKEMVPAEEQSQCLATAIFHVVKLNTFMGSVLQCMNITYTHVLPTAGVMFNSEVKRWDLLINPYFFCRKLNKEHREAVLLHELYHITHKHPLRVPFLNLSTHKRQLMNIAMDMAINQFIKNLPDGCPQCPPRESYEPCKNPDCCSRGIFLKDFFDVDEKTGKQIPWDAKREAEYYYEKLLERFDDPDPNDQNSGGNQQGDCETCDGTGKVPDQSGGSGQQQGQQGQGGNQQGQQGPGGNQPGNGHGEGGTEDCPDCSGSGQQQGQQGQGQQGKQKGNAGGGAQTGDLPETTDVHHWDGSSEERDMLEATEDLVKRAMVKTRFGHDDLPGHIKELLEHIETRKAQLNYKALILAAMKKSLPANFRVKSWTRKSRRFGNKAPGNRNGEQPKLDNYVDTSGSISIEEANEFLDIVDEFLRVGAKECMLNMFHTSNYYREKYKRGQRIKREDIQSGGTCLQDSFEQIAKYRPDLAVVLTDGYYGGVDTKALVGPNGRFPNTVFIISKGGTVDHPFKDEAWAITVKIPDTSSGRHSRGF